MFKRILRATSALLLLSAALASPARPATDVVARGLAANALSVAQAIVLSGGGVVNVRTVTSADPATPGAITLLPSDQVVFVAMSPSAALVVNFTCSAGLNKVVVDFTGVDQTFPITLNPLGSGANINGKSTFVMNQSVPNVPAYESRGIVCDSNGNASIY